MIISRKVILRFSQLPKILHFYRRSFLSDLQRCLPTCCNCKKYFSGSCVRLKDEIPSTLAKYELFSEQTAPVILDVEEEREKVTTNKTANDEFEGVNLERAVSGVFDISEIVELLKKEKGENIFVGKVPPEYNYADYMVIVTGRSTRHMTAISDYIRKVYKVKVKGTGHMPQIEGKNSKIWMAIDLGNIILHVFSRTGREMYDLETLWSVGKDFDTLSQKKTISDGLLTDYSKILASLSPNI